MRIIKVGRDRSNDVVVNDPYVSSMHCDFIFEDNGNVWVVDHSKNGTFVNGQRRQGKTQIMNNDIIRIGNETLPWQSWSGGVASSNGYGGNYGGGYGGGYGGNISDPEPQKRGKAVSILGFIFGVLAFLGILLTFAEPEFVILTMLFCLPAIILSAIGVGKDFKGFAIPGLVFGILSTIILLIAIASVPYLF